MNIPINIPSASDESQLLRLMFDAIDAARKEQLPSGDAIADQKRGTAMAFQIMEAISAGERDPARLKLAALNATAGRRLDC